MVGDSSNVEGMWFRICCICIYREIQKDVSEENGCTLSFI